MIHTQDLYRSCSDKGSNLMRKGVKVLTNATSNFLKSFTDPF